MVHTLLTHNGHIACALNRCYLQVARTLLKRCSHVELTDCLQTLARCSHIAHTLNSSHTADTLVAQCSFLFAHCSHIAHTRWETIKCNTVHAICLVAADGGLKAKAGWLTNDLRQNVRTQTVHESWKAGLDMCRHFPYLCVSSGVSDGQMSAKIGWEHRCTLPSKLFSAKRCHLIQIARLIQTG